MGVRRWMLAESLGSTSCCWRAAQNTCIEQAVVSNHPGSTQNKFPMEFVFWRWAVIADIPQTLARLFLTGHGWRNHSHSGVWETRMRGAQPQGSTSAGGVRVDTNMGSGHPSFSLAVGHCAGNKARWKMPERTPKSKSSVETEQSPSTEKTSSPSWLQWLHLKWC